MAAVLDQARGLDCWAPSRLVLDSQNAGLFAVAGWMSPDGLFLLARNHVGRYALFSRSVDHNYQVATFACHEHAGAAARYLLEVWPQLFGQPVNGPLSLDDLVAPRRDLISFGADLTLSEFPT